MPAAKVPYLMILAMGVLSFGLAARLEPVLSSLPGRGDESANAVGGWLGDSRRLFANHFFIKADSYFHSGYYPGIFDNGEAFQTPHMAEDAGVVAGRNKGNEETFLGPPRDWIERFGRQFFPSTHTHLDEGGPTGDLGKGSDVREILPWLELSAKLDSHRIETYMVTAYWLRERMGKVAEAEQFLREGLRANPDSYEILYELGRCYAESRNDPTRARNLWTAALSGWRKQESAMSEPNRFLLNQIASHLAVVEENQGDYAEALAHMEIWKTATPFPDQVQKRIDELRQKMAAKKMRFPPPPARIQVKTQ